MTVFDLAFVACVLSNGLFLMVRMPRPPGQGHLAPATAEQV